MQPLNRVATPMLARTGLLLLAALTGLPRAVASQSVPRVVTGWGRGHDGGGVVGSGVARGRGDGLSRWADYLRGDPRQQRPTPHWSTAEHRQWPAYDLTAGSRTRAFRPDGRQPYKGFPATVLAASRR